MQAKLNGVELARGDVEDLKALLLDRLNQLNEKVRAFFAGSKRERVLPAVPSTSDGPAVFAKALDEAVTLWQRLDLSLPRLTPAAGSTPAAVTITVTWDAATGQAHITWTASTAGDLLRYEIRFVAGPNYHTDDESFVGSVLASDPREFFTTAGLATAGTVASFKVYVITITGHEKGSEAVSVVRPVSPLP